MLPSLGFFKDVNCPFFKNGLCERPHCHFRHSRPDATVSRIDIKQELFNVLGSTLGLEQPSSSVPATYIPTPVEKCGSVKPQGILKPATSIIKIEKAIPEYKPTPICKLQEPPKEDSVSTLNARKRKKYEEYIPEEVKQRKVSFALPNDDDDDDNNNKDLSESSDEDDDTADFDARFSDEDDYNKEQNKFVSETSVVASDVDSKETEEEMTDNKTQYSLVDKILGEVNKNEEFIKNFSKPPSIKVLCNKQMAKENPPAALDTGIIESKVNKEKLIENTNSSEKASKNKPVSSKSEKKIESVKPSSYKEQTAKVKSSSSSSSENKKSKEDDKNIKKSSGSTHTDNKHSKLKNKEKISHGEKSKDATSTKEKTKSTDQKSSKSDKKTEAKKSSSKSVESSSKSKSGLCDESKKHSTHKSKESSKDSKSKESSKDTKSKESSKDAKSKDKKSEHHTKSSKTDKDKSKLKHKSSGSSSKSSSSSSSLLSNSHESIRVTKKIQDEKISSSSIVNKSKSSSHSENVKLKDNLKTERSSSSSGQVSKGNDSCSNQKDRKKNVKDFDAKYKDVKEKKAKEETDEEVEEEEEKSEESSDSDEMVSIPPDAEDDADYMDPDTYEECFRIFQESSLESGIKNKNESSSDNEEKYEEIVTFRKNTQPKFSLALQGSCSDAPFGSKKRVAHNSDFKRDIDQKQEPRKMTNAVQVMHNRYLQLKEMYEKQNTKKVNMGPTSFLSAVNKSSDCPKKFMTLPSGSLIEAVKNKASMLSSASSTSSSVEEPLPKNKRVAHVPKSLLKPRPIIPTEYGSKVPSNVRQRYLNTFIDECLKFCITENQAFEMALEEEKKAYDRSTNKTIYLNVAAISLNRLRHRAVEGPPAEIPEDINTDESLPSAPAVSSTTSSVKDKYSKRGTVSHQTVLAGARAQKTSFSIEKKKNKTQEFTLKGIALYNALSEYIMTEDQLIENGFPMAHETEVGRAVMAGVYSNKQMLCNDRYKRICCRCRKTYYVDDDGDYVKEEECDFHWGRIFKRRIAGSIESRHMCCQGDAESEGCCVGQGHVFEGSEYHVTRGFVKTLPKTPPPDKYYGVYALDCEMCYTTAGIELTRVTVINPDLKAVFETFVKPEHRVLDYNTRFSGITEDDLVGVTTTIRDVQAILLCMFNDKTILIGHSLESDFKALKLIHHTVVDTSVVFPHKLGLPYKRALRTLMAEKCNRIIQNDMEGHDSHEDAAACMELMLVKLKEDLKYVSR